MRFDKMKTAAPSENDPPAMREAIRVLLDEAYDVRRPNPHQLKVTPEVSYYPSNGKILVDGQSVHAERGLDALLRLLRGGSADQNGSIIATV